MGADMLFMDKALVSLPHFIWILPRCRQPRVDIKPAVKRAIRVVIKYQMCPEKMCSFTYCKRTQQVGVCAVSRSSKV